MKSFIDVFDIKAINRIGLRYINDIDLEKKGIKDVGWEKYINSNLLGGLVFSKEIGDISRTMTHTIIKKDELSVNFRYGFWNSDYPSKILKWNLVLDYDCVSNYPIDISEKDIQTMFNEYNSEINIVFEKSIKDEFRNLLNNKTKKNAKKK